MDDLISRQAVRMSKKLYDEDLSDYERGWNDACDAIADGAPSAQPERKTGHWIEYIPEHGKCPFCGNQVDLLGGKINNFCGECGADMRGGNK